MPSSPAAASRAIDDSGTTSPRLTAAGCAKTVMPPHGLDQPDRVEGVELVLLGVGAPAVREPFGREGVGDGLDDAELDKCGGDVR